MGVLGIYRQVSEGLYAFSRIKERPLVSEAKAFIRTYLELARRDLSKLEEQDLIGIVFSFV